MKKMASKMASEMSNEMNIGVIIGTEVQGPSEVNTIHCTGTQERVLM